MSTALSLTGHRRKRTTPVKQRHAMAHTLSNTATGYETPVVARTSASDEMVSLFSKMPFFNNIVEMVLSFLGAHVSLMYPNHYSSYVWEEYKTSKGGVHSRVCHPWKGESLKSTKMWLWEPPALSVPIQKSLAFIATQNWLFSSFSCGSPKEGLQW